MHALIVLAHPEARSLNGHLKDVAVEELKALGYDVEVSIPSKGHGTSPTGR